ncbi:MAG TPA: PAS domain S-box protein, partial [Tepidisphaeraceae bacterium]
MENQASDNDDGGPEQVRLAVQARLAAIVESSDDAIVSKTLEGIISTWNKGAERIFGYTSDEAVGRSITLIIPEDRLYEEPQILARIRAGHRIDHYETVRQRKDGRLIDVSVTISPMRDADGRIVGVSKIARDVTETKQAQRELQAAKESAEAANRAKDHFLSVLSHELRTPLTPVLAAVSVVERNPAMSIAELHEHMGMIRRNIETEARLVDDLLDLTRVARGKVQLQFEVLDAHVALRTAVAMFQADIDAKGLSVTVALRARDRHVWADAGRFQQVFLNLLSNAVKFTPQDGSITVRTSNESGSGLRIEVTDTGVGIDPAEIPRLFNAFEQADRTVARRYGGLGLGLSIAKAMIDLHNGRLTGHSAGVGTGASFVVELATVPPPPAPSAVPSMPSLTATSRTTTAQQEAANYRILLVEDHVDTREVLRRLLRSFGCEVITAGSVREAMDLSDRETFDLLVSDIGL